MRLHHEYAGSFFFGSGTDQDAVDSSTVIVELGAGGLGIAGSRLLHQDRRQEREDSRAVRGVHSAVARTGRERRGAGQGRRGRDPAD
jgi:hypothetical protein